MAVLIFLGCLLGGIAIGLPIAWALLLCGAALMFWLDMFDVQIMAQTLVNGADSFSLLAIPFFVLAGEIMNAGGLSKRIVDLPMKLVGHKPGGLGYVGVLAAMIMASLSGSAVADTAAVAAFYALFVATVIYREMTFATLWHVLIGAAKTTSVVMFLVASAQVSAWLITIAELPMMVSDLLQPLVDSPRLLFIVIMVAILIVGMVMDLTPTVLILTPVLMPLVKEAGIDPIYFGVMFIINCSIGLITPPIGNVLNVISGVAKLKFDDAVRGVFPYVLVLYSLLVVFVFIPDLIILPLKWIN
ncbi:TPA: TRAP transporter large permease subunit [Escherichia coli]|nr:TRAP transporter large permease subunit [Escherichia coli]